MKQVMSDTSAGAMKKILVVVNKLSRAGAEKQLLLILQKLKDKYQFQIITLYGEGDYEAPFIELGVPIRHWELDGSLLKPGNLRQIFQLIRYALKYKPDIIHSWLFHSNMISTVLKILSRKRGLIVSIRGSNYWHRRVHLVISNLIYRICDCIITNSPQLRMEILGNNADGQKIELVYNGVEVKANDAGLQKADLFASEKANGKVIVGCVGRFVKEKRYSDVLEAARKLIKQYENILFVLVGGRGEYELYKNKIENSGLKNRVILVGEVDNPLDYIRSFSIFLMTSSHEGMPNSMMEAMAMGKAVVATSVGAIPDLVTPEVNGILVPVAAPEQIVSALQRLIDDPALTDTFGMNNLRKMQDFSVDKMVSRYERIYERIIESYS